MIETDRHILLAKWQDGTISQDELKHLKNQVDLTDLEVALERLDSYDLGPMDEDKFWDNLTQLRQEKPPKSKSSLPIWLKIASSIIVLIGASLWLWDYSGTTVVLAQNGQQKEVQLPNKSIVILNSGSRLTYYHRDWDNKRRLKLSGEAYFKVTKGVSFEVETPNGKIGVLGTQFNVYDRDEKLKVVCFEGSVKVNSKTNNMEKILTKGNGVLIENTDSISFEETMENPFWLVGVSSFSKASLNEVFSELERQYDIKLNIKNINLQRKFTGEFSDNNLDKTLQKICGAMDLKYSILPESKMVVVSSK